MPKVEQRESGYHLFNLYFEKKKHGASSEAKKERKTDAFSKIYGIVCLILIDRF